MALIERVREVLDRAGAPHRLIPHPDAATAHDVAHASHVSERALAKVVVVRAADGALEMVVLPAACRVDLVALRDTTGKRHLELVHEDELPALFPDCELGAMPPFGELYALPVYVDACFAEDGDFYFQAGNHHETVGMRYRDWARIVRPVRGAFCLHGREKVLTE